MFFNRFNRGKKPLTSPDIIKKLGLLKKKGPAGWTRRYALPLGALLVLVSFVLTAVIEPAKAGTYTQMPSGATAAAGKIAGTPATDMDSDDSVYTIFKDNTGNYRMDIDVTLDTFSAQANRIYKAVLTIDAFVNKNYDGNNYYVKMFTGPLATDYQDFDIASLGSFTTTDGSSDTVTLTESNIAKAQAFYNGGTPKVKLMNALIYNGTADNLASELSVDYLDVTFYEDINQPTTGSLSPASNSSVSGIISVTLANVQDNASVTESGMQDVVFEYSSDLVSWYPIGTDTTPDAGNNYTVNWDTSAFNGSYTIRAAARDKVGNIIEVTSTNVILGSDTTAPVNVYIQSPANFKRVNNPTITVHAEDNVGVAKVEFYSQANPLFPFGIDFDPAGGWTYIWDTSNQITYVENNSYWVKVKAYDAANNSTTSTENYYTIDRTAPSVQNTEPGNDNQSVPTNRPPIRATFDGPMDQSAFIANSTFMLKQEDNQAVIPGQITGYDPAAYTVTFTPDADLPAEKWFTATLTSGVKDEAGNSLIEYNWRFRTIDTSSPVVSAIDPPDTTPLKREQRVITASASDNVGVTKVEFYWSEAVTGPWYIIGAPDTTIADGWTTTLDTAALPHDGNYYIKALAYDAKYPQNPPGERLVSYNIDKTLPQVLPFSLSPVDGAEEVSRTPNIQAAFSEAMTEETVNSTNVYLTRFGSLEVIPTTLIFDPVSKTVIITLPANTVLDYNTQYTAHITASITDLRGNPLESPLTWSFTTIADLVPPAITIQGVSPKTISPQNGDGQKDSTLVSFNLSEKASVYLEVYDSMGNKVYQSPTVNFLDEGALTNLGISWDGKNDTGEFVPDSNYTLYLRAQDTAGNSTRQLVLDQVIVDNQGPYITQVVPESRTKVIISFSEPMDANTAQTLSFNTVIKETYSPVALTLSNFTRLDSMNFSVESVEQQRTDRTWYTIIINNVLDQVGNFIHNPGTFDFTGFNPHGLYGSKTSLCSSCHLTHSSQGSRLINSTGVKLLCYVCHNGGGQSTYNTVKTDLQKNSHHPVEMPSNGGGLISCEDCHNVHGDIITTETLYPKLLRAKNTTTGQIASQGNEYCWACHGTGSTLPAPNGDKQTYYPPDGTVHNDVYWEPFPNDPSKNTKIGCSKCHLNHGSDRIKLIPPSLTYKGVTVALDSVGNCVCCTCHNSNPNQDNFDYNGRAIYADSTRNPHASRRCPDCHDPHSQQVGKLLKRTFITKPDKDDVNGDTYFEEDFTWDNVQTCVGCHTGTHVTMPKMTQKFKEYDVASETYKLPTTFWNDSIWDPDNYNLKTNLHDYHLNLKNYQPGFGNVTCKECHRFHGPINEENPNGFGRIYNGGNGKSRMVGFPMRGPKSVQNYIYAEPVWKMIDIEGQPAGGTCNLVCHGKVHDDVQYLAGTPPAPEISKDSSCYSCHGGLDLPNSMEIQALMGSWEGGGGQASHHIVANVDKEFLAGTNNCMTECHKPHSQIDKFANNTIATSWDSVNKIMSNDPALCQNTYCHTTNQIVPDPTDPSGHIAPPITNQFNQTLHGKAAGTNDPYETIYHDYDVSQPGQGKYKGNCLKCHNPHGTSKPRLLDFKAGSTISGSTTFSGNDNSVCDLCHLDGLANTPNYQNKALYNKTNHGDRLLKLSDSENGHCDSCHDPHGKEDGSGLIPNMLKIRGTAGCYDCHDSFKSLTPDWTGSTGYNAGAHQLYANDGNSERGTGYCEVCHATHGKDDGTGNPIKELLWSNEEGSCFLPGASGTACHGTNAKSALNGNKNIDIKTLYDKTYKHGNLYDSDKHLSTERTMPNLNRHAECEDCHNSHSAKARTGFTDGTNAVKPSEVNVWGITPAEPWPVPASGSLASPSNWTVVENSQYEWQICFKCHSKWAYGSSPPNSTDWLGNSIAQTDTPAEFNPNNYAHHAVIDPGKNQPGSANPNGFENTFVTGWGPGSTLACSDCHSSNISTEPKGTHGSNFRYILKSNSSGGANFCINCHDIRVYGDYNFDTGTYTGPSTTAPYSVASRWDHSRNGGSHYGSSHVSKITCLNCHMGSPGSSHGSNQGPGSLTEAGFINQPLGKRMMNGSAMYSYNTKDGAIACYSVGGRVSAASPLSACTKGHNSQQSTDVRYNY